MGGIYDMHLQFKFSRTILQICLVICLVLGGTAQSVLFTTERAYAVTSFMNVNYNTSTPAMYDKYELTFNLNKTYLNPFNPDEVNVYAVFTTPSSQTEVVPAFYKSNSSPNWAVRYSPREAGVHTVTMYVDDEDGIGVSSTYSFTAGGAGSNRGFMMTQDDRFIDSYGSQITLLGTNFAWNNPDPYAVIEEIPNLEPAKMNLLRVWYSCWWSSFAPEWGPVTAYEAGLTTEYEGLGRYQLDNQQRVDEMFEEAEEHNVYIMFTLNSFGDMYYQWNVNAYNTANGGPVTYSENNTNFWTDATAIDYQKKLLRYVFARYGYSRSLGILEYWNELDNRVDTTAANRASWHSAVDSYWKSLDFYNHPTTTSFAWKDHAGSGQTSWENLTMLDVTNVHRYDDSANVIDAWQSQIENLHTIGGNKPAFIGEVGRTHNDTTTDPTIANYMHNSLWAPIFRAGAAGGSLWWIFENGFELPSTFKSIYTRLANFVQPEEDHLIDMPHVDYGLQSNNTKIGGFNDGSRALLWINDTQANHTVTSPRTVSGMTLSVPMDNDNYQVSFYDTYTGTYSTPITTGVSSGTLSVTVPNFTRDIAVNIKCVSCETVDDVAPTVPTGLTAHQVSDTSITILWSPSTDNVAVTDYEVFMNDTYLDNTSGATTYTINTLSANTTYTFTVRAKDGAGNLSSHSTALSVTTSAPDTTPPTAPSNLTSPGKTDVSVQLSWDAATDNVGVTGYDVYRDSVLVGSTVASQLSFNDLSLQPLTTYTYYIKAKDANHNQSSASNSITVTTLSPIAVNLLSNPGFEAGGSKVNNWVCENDYFCYRDTSVKRSEGASMRMSGDSGPWLAFYQEVSAVANETYTFNGYANTASNNGTTLEIHLRFYDASNNLLRDDLLSTHTGNSSGFFQIGGEKVSPSGTTKAQVYIYMRDLRGALYFDDFSLTTSVASSDTIAPTAPTALVSSNLTDESFDLSWTAATDNIAVTNYEIYADSVLVATIGNVTNYSFSNLSANTSYSITVKAKDAAGNTSISSSALVVTTLPASGGGGNSENLLENGGFETVASNGKPTDWICEQDYYCYSDSSVKRSDSQSLRLDGSSGPWFAVYQTVDHVGSSYSLDGYINIVNNNGSQITISVQFLNSSDTVIQENTVANYNNTTTSGFEQLAGTYTAPSGTDKVRVRIYMRDFRALMYLDDFTLTTD